LSDDDEDEEEDIDVASSSSADSTHCRYSVENSYNEEKEQACLALREICINTGSSFLPYIEKSFEEIFKLINYPQDDIRKASVDALLQFCIALHKMNSNETKQALYKALQMFVPKCAELIRSDEERGVVMCCLDAYASLLDEVKGDVLVGEGHREAIMNCVIDVLTLKTMCQDTDLDAATETNDDDAEAEHDELLLESAGDVIPKFAAAITPDDFVLYFPNILQLMTQRTVIATRSPRLLANAVISEKAAQHQPEVVRFRDSGGVHEVSGRVRGKISAAPGAVVVGRREGRGRRGAKQRHLRTRRDDSARQERHISVSFQKWKSNRLNFCFVTSSLWFFLIVSLYQDILQALSASVAKESHAGTLDNICGALAKMIIANSAGIPLEQVFPAFLQRLPLRDDFQENEAVVECFCSLYREGNAIFRQHLSDVIKIIVQVYHKKQYPNDETKTKLVELIKIINRDFSEEFGNTVSSLGPEVTNSLQNLFTAS
jgi:hypothetical protein